MCTGGQDRLSVQFTAGHTLCCVLEGRRAWATVDAFNAATGEISLTTASSSGDPQTTTHQLLPSQLHTSGRRPFNPYGHLELKENTATASQLRAEHWASGAPSCAVVSVLTCDVHQGGGGDREKREVLEQFVGAEAELSFPEGGNRPTVKVQVSHSAGRMQLQLRRVDAAFSTELHRQLGRTGTSLQLLLSGTKVTHKSRILKKWPFFEMRHKQHVPLAATVAATPASIVPCFALHERVLLPGGRTVIVQGYEKSGLYRLQGGKDDAPSQALAQARPETVFRYAEGTKLIVLLVDAAWTDVVVTHPTPTDDAHSGSCRHGLHVTGVTDDASGTIWMDLNAANHAPQHFTCMAEFKQKHADYLQHTQDKFSLVEDGITGNKLLVAEQLLYIRTLAIAKDPRAEGIKDVASLVDFLAPSDVDQDGGGQPTATANSEPEPVLVMAAAGTGKTWTMWS